LLLLHGFEFLDLTDCSGASVTGNTGGTFQVVTQRQEDRDSDKSRPVLYNMDVE